MPDLDLPLGAIGDDALEFDRHLPAIRVWYDATRRRVIVFDNARNSPVVTPLTPEAVYEAPTSEAQSHKLWPHVYGHRLRCKVDWTIYGPGWLPPSVNVPPIQGVTLTDLQVLHMAHVCDYDVEFYPHGAGGMPADKDTHYLVEIVNLTSGREPAQPMVHASMEVRTLTPLVSVPLTVAIPYDWF